MRVPVPLIVLELAHAIVPSDGHVPPPPVRVAALEAQSAPDRRGRGQREGIRRDADRRIGVRHEAVDRVGHFRLPSVTVPAAVRSIMTSLLGPGMTFLPSSLAAMSQLPPVG